MNKFIEKNWFKLIILIIILFIIYWQGVRPSQIRSICYQSSEKSSSNTKIESIIDKYASGKETQEELYNKCLLRHGLEK